MKLLKTFQNRGLKRLLFKTIPKPGASVPFRHVIRNLFVQLGHTVQKHDFYSAFAAFFHKMAEGVPPALQPVPALLQEYGM